MESDNFGTPLKDTLEEFKKYIEIQVIYNKLVFTKKAGELTSYLFLLLLLFGLSSFVLLFFSFAFASWFGDITKLGIGTGYLVVACFYIILAIIVYAFRKPLIFNPIRKIFGNIFFGNETPSKDSYNFTFDSEQSQIDDIKIAHDELTAHRDSLNEKINKLGETFTFTNIAHQLIGRAYDSVMTTSNIAKFTYKLIKKLKWFSARKKKKIAKQKQDKLIEGDDK